MTNMFVALAVVIACFGSTVLASIPYGAECASGVTPLKDVPMAISSDRDPYSCTGNACEHIKLVICHRSDANWKCDSIHKKNIAVFKPKVSCNSECVVGGVSCGVVVHTELKTLNTAETIVGGMTMIFLCFLLGPTMFAAILFGALLDGDKDEYTSTSYDDC